MLANENEPITMAYKLSEYSLVDKITQLSEEYGIKLIPWDNVSGQSDQTELPLLRLTKHDIQLEHQGELLFFHPSMALLRMINIKRGIGDRFLKALRVQEGDVILDATMGLASDALIASWAAGERGRVMAIEYSPIIHLLVNEGLKQFQHLQQIKVANQEKEQAWLELARASSRIDTLCAEHNSFLAQLPDASVDIIYFDPMFRDTVSKSSSIKPLKNLSHPESLKLETIQQACRVARKRIVLKERNNGGEFERLGFSILNHGKYSSVSYGVIELKNKREEEVPCSP